MGTRARILGVCLLALAVGCEDDARGKAPGEPTPPDAAPMLDGPPPDASQVDGIKIRWPSGDVQELPAVAADQALIVTEGSSKLRRVY